MEKSRLKNWGQESSLNPLFCAHVCATYPELFAHFDKHDWFLADRYIPVPRGAVEMEMSIKNFLRAGNIAQPPFLCTPLFPPTQNYSHTFHKMTLCSALLIHRGYISSAVDAFVCMTLIHNRYYLLGP